MEKSDLETKKFCLRCHKLNDNHNNYCIYCGTPVRNICTNKVCENYISDETLSNDAVFCPSCGSETLFKVHGLVSCSLDTISEEDLPF